MHQLEDEILKLQEESETLIEEYKKNLKKNEDLFEEFIRRMHKE